MILTHCSKVKFKLFYSIELDSIRFSYKYIFLRIYCNICICLQAIMITVDLFKGIANKYLFTKTHYSNIHDKILLHTIPKFRKMYSI